MHVLLLLLETFLELLEIGEEFVEELLLVGGRYVGEELVDLIADRYGVYEKCAVSLIVESVWIAGVEIDEGGDFLGVTGAYGA